MFDSLKYAKILEDSGLPRNQAETHIRILNDVIEGEMATKQDLNLLKHDLEISISSLGKELRSEIKSEISGLSSNLRSEMNNLEHRIIYKLGGLMAACLTIGISAVQLINN